MTIVTSSPGPARKLLAALVAVALVAATPAGAQATGEAAPVGSPLQFRLITGDQYLNTITNVFGPDVRPQLRFAQMQRVQGLLQLGAMKASVSEGDVETYQTAAQLVVAAITKPERREFLLPCRPADATKADDACARQILKRFGELMFRRSMAPAELDQYTAVAAESAVRVEDFYRGVGVALEAVLISPETLFVAESAEPDPEHPGRLRLKSFPLASRLSYFLWNAAPDRALLEAAAQGELDTEKGRARAVERMMASPRFETGMRAFFDDMFALDELSRLSKDPLIYPNFTLATALDAREQILRTLFDQLIRKAADYRDIFTTRETFMSPALASIYEVPSPPGWVPHQFAADGPRAGLLTQVGFLAGHSHPGRSSPTLRGKALRELVLCQPVPSPPPNVDFGVVENPSPNLLTQRDRINEHLQNPVCAGCHRITDPMGLALENFDGSGVYRKFERGSRIDPSGKLAGKDFTDAADMGRLLRDDPNLASCLVKRMYAFATGDTEQAGIAPTLEYLDKRFAEDGYRMPDLIRTITSSKSFSLVRSE